MLKEGPCPDDLQFYRSVGWETSNPQGLEIITQDGKIQSVYRRILRDGGADDNYIAGFEALCLREIKRQGMTMWAELEPQELYVELNLVGDIHKY